MGHDVVTDRNGATPKSLWYRISHFVYHAIRFYILKDYRYYPYRYLFLSINTVSYTHLTLPTIA